MPNTAIVALVGSYGVGKSVLLGQVKKQMSDKTFDWFQFDAWKYPDRQDLWEGFILDFAKYKNKKLFREMEQKLNVEYGKKKAGLVKTGSLLAKTVGNIHFPGAGSIAGDALDKLTYLFTTSPVHRLYGYEKLLTELLGKSKKDLYIVLEDVDRSKEAGLLFLETVSHFFRNKGLHRKIRVIVPVSEYSLKEPTSRASFIKAVDYLEEFNGKDLDVTNFIQEVIVDEITQNPKSVSQLKTFFENIINSGHINVRILKMIVRSADNRYKNLLEKRYKVNPIICIVIETLKYLPSNDSNGLNQYEQALGRRNIREGIANLVLISIGRNEPVHETIEFLNAHKLGSHNKTVTFSNEKDFRKENADIWLENHTPTQTDKKINPKIPDIYFFEY